MASTTGKAWIISKRSDGTVHMEDFVPVLTNLSVPAASVGASSATVQVTTSVASGQAYVVVTGSAVQPAVSQIKAGTDHNGNPPLFKTSVLVSAAGQFEIPLVGLSSVAQKYVYVVQNANNYDSAPLSTSFFLNISAFPLYSAATSAVPPAGWFNLRDASPVIAAIPLAAGATLTQNGPLNPVDKATLQLADGYLARVVFVEFGNDAPVQPTPVNKLRALANASSLQVPVATLGGIAANQGLIMMIVSRAVLTVTPATQGWTLQGKLEQPGSTPHVYVYSKVSVAAEATINLTHSGGRILALVTNYINVDLTHLLDVAPVFFPGDDDLLTVYSPTITPISANSTVVSAIGHANNPVYTSPPANYTAWDAFYGSGGVFFLGQSHRKLPVAAATGDLLWGLSHVGGTWIGVTFALRSTATGILKYPFTVPLRRTLAGVNTDFNLNVDPYG